MDENKDLETTVPAEPAEDRDQELFSAIGAGKKRKKRRRIIIVAVILALVAGGLFAAVRYGRNKVREQFVSSESTESVQVYMVDTGNVTTTVGGSGQLADADTRTLTLPKGVEVDEIVAELGQTVRKGDVLATVESSSVLTAMADTQKKISELDAKLRTSANDAVKNFLTTNVAGRVKLIYAQEGDDVAARMVESGALAVLSLDGYMAADVPAGSLKAGDAVKVKRADGAEIKGTVEKVLMDTATVLVTDNGPMADEKVTVFSSSGEELGSGALYIHNPLRITGYAGTIAKVNVSENANVYAGSSLFALRDTAYTANYESILKQRRDLEETLLDLLAISRAGALTAPIDGTVSLIDYKSSDSASSDAGSSSGTDLSGLSGMGALDAGSLGGSANSGTGSSTGSSASSDETKVITLSTDEAMNVTITVDETDILSLQIGQEAQVTINSIGETFSGEVTEINKNAKSEYGVTSYSAVISVPKDERMLPGMSVRALIRIQGVAGAVLIPSEALHETKDSAFVYTSYNYETGEFGDPVQVVPGLNDGSMVEIVEGLQQGDFVFYTVVVNPWDMYYTGEGSVSDGDAVWVDTSSSTAVIEMDLVTGGDA